MIDIIHYNLPGIVLGVSSITQRMHYEIHGLSDIEHGKPMVSNLLFQNGKITRLFTAVILLKLVETNLLDLDLPLEPLSRLYQNDQGRLHLIINQYPFLKPVTVRQLLNHTSGIPSYNKTVAYQKAFMAKPKKVWQVEAFLDLISSDAHYCAHYEPLPRGFFSDSATNYILAGLVIEAITGNTLAFEMQQLFENSALKQTFYSDQGILDPVHLANLTHGYLSLSDPFAVAFQNASILNYNKNKELCVYDVTNAYNFNGWGGSASMSSVSDLIVWLNDLLHGKILKSSIKELFHMIPMNPKQKNSQNYYGLGLYKTMLPDIGEVLWVAGNTYGYSVLLGYLLDKGLTFCLATNTNRYKFSIHEPQLVQPLLNRLK